MNSEDACEFIGFLRTRRILVNSKDSCELVGFMSSSLTLLRRKYVVHFSGDELSTKAIYLLVGEFFINK